MSKSVRDMSTPETRAFWEAAQESAALVENEPNWMKAGVNLSENFVTYRGDKKVES